MEYSNYSDLIPQYLRNLLIDEQRRAFEEELSRSDDLRKELYEIAEIMEGLDIADSLELDHAPSEAIALYAEDPSKLDSERKTNLETHLNECSECREELYLCRRSGLKTGWISRFFNWIVEPAPSIKPAYGLAAMLVLTVVGYYGVQHMGEQVPGYSSFELNPSATRGWAEENKIVLQANTAVLELDIVAPYAANHTYDFRLLDSTSTHILIFPSCDPPTPLDKALAVDIPTSYLTEGEYRMIIIEFNTAGEPTAEFEIDFSIARD